MEEANSAGAVPQQSTTQARAGFRANAPLAPDTHKHLPNVPGPDVEVRIDAEEGISVPDPRLRQDHPLHNKRGAVSARGYDSSDDDDDDDADRQQRNTSRIGRLLPPAAAGGGGRRRRPLPAEDNENREDFLGDPTIGDHGEGGNRVKQGNGNAVPRVRAAGDARNASGMSLDLSGPEESNGLRSNKNDSTIPQGAAGKIPGEQGLRGQRSSGSVGAQRSGGSHSHLDPAGAAEERRRTGTKTNYWDTFPREIVEKRAARPMTTVTAADGASRHTHRRGGGKRGSQDSAAHLTREAAEKEEAADGGHSVASGLTNGDDRFARERPGDRYYLPPPQRNSRPRTSPDDTRGTNSSRSSRSSTPRRNEKRRSELQQGPAREPREIERQQRQRRHHRKRSRAMSAHGDGDGGGGDNADSSSSVQSRRRDGRRSSSSDRFYPQQAADHRPMMGVSEASGAPKMPDWRYGWRGPFTATASAQSQEEEESLPYYVERKQVCGRDRAKTLTTK